MHSEPRPIVVVDDDPNDVFFIRHALESARIQNPLSVFESAEGVRAYLGALPAGAGPVLIILDLNLSGNESGLDVLTWIREQPEPLSATPTMMLTGSVRPEDREDCRRRGAVTFLEKPVTEATLTSAVQQLGFVIVLTRLGQAGARVIQRRDGQ
jgi:CheY-like chemotaxis protein